MQRFYPPLYFPKVMVPVLYGVEDRSALALARTLVGNGKIILKGLVSVPPGDSLSAAALLARRLRAQLNKLADEDDRIYKREHIRVTTDLWAELISVSRKEHPDLLIIEWSTYDQAIRMTSANQLDDFDCDLAIVRGPFPDVLQKVLVALRGGPFAELALRVSLSLAESAQVQVTSLHVPPQEADYQLDAPFRGLSNVLSSLPDIRRLEIPVGDPAQAIVTQSHEIDLVVMGASGRSWQDSPLLGGVAQRVLNESQNAVVIVRTGHPAPVEISGEMAGKTAISVLVDRWFAENTYHADEFSHLERLLAVKEEQGLSISLALPALNEEATVGKVLRTIKASLMDHIPLLDEMVLMDSSSTDNTRQIAQDLGVPVYIHQQVLHQYGPRRGKGEALWKSLYVTRGDILVWIDTDISNIHPRFVYGLLGPLLFNPNIQFIKGFYRRPLKVGDKIQAGGGGRVTELTARPLLNLFYPELSGVIQPLSGEYGGRRSALEKMPFFSGYGVEIGLLIDVFEFCGLSAIAQVDLSERIHHNQPLESLSKMSFAVIQAVIRKLEQRYGRNFLEDVNRTMKLISYEKERFLLEVVEIAEKERPPMIELPEYQEVHPS